MQEIWVQSLGWEDPLYKGMATHSSIHSWKIPMDKGAWRVTVHGVAKSQIGLSNQTTTNKDIVKLFVCLWALHISFQNYFYFFLSAVLGLHCFAQAFSSCGKWGLLFLAVWELLIAGASLVCRAWAVGGGLRQLRFMDPRGRSLQQ